MRICTQPASRQQGASAKSSLGARRSRASKAVTDLANLVNATEGGARGLGRYLGESFFKKEASPPWNRSQCLQRGPSHDEKRWIFPYFFLYSRILAVKNDCR